MTPDERLDRGLQEYLQAGPNELADRVVWAVHAQLPTIRQRRRRLGRWLPGGTPMSDSTKLLAVAGAALALVVVVGGGLFNAFLPGPGVGTSPSPSEPGRSPEPSPTPKATFTAGLVAKTTATEVAPAWTVSGTPDTTFWTPVMAPDGRIWVPANELDVIRIYEQDGKLAETWGTPGTGDGAFRFGNSDDSDGAGVIFAPDESFYVLDSSNFRVQHFASDRRFLSSWGSYGSDDGQFISPVAIGLDDAGNIYVSDAGRNDVQVFTTGGTYVRTVAKGAAGDSLWGSGPGWFMTTRLTDDGPGAMEYHSDGTVQGGWDMRPFGCEPSGVTRDQSPRNIYITCVADGQDDYLFRFDEGGTLLRTWAIAGLGLAVSPDGSAAFVVSEDQESLVRYDLDPPSGG